MKENSTFLFVIFSFVFFRAISNPGTIGDLELGFSKEFLFFSPPTLRLKVISDTQSLSFLFINHTVGAAAEIASEFLTNLQVDRLSLHYIKNEIRSGEILAAVVLIFT